MGRSRQIGVGRAGSGSFGRLALGLSVAGFALATILSAIRPIVARRFVVEGMLPPGDLDPFVDGGLIAGVVFLVLALAWGARALVTTPPAWLVTLVGAFRGSDPEHATDEVLDALAPGVRGRREGNAVAGRFRDRDVRIAIVRDGLSARHYEMRLSTPYGAPRAGRVSATDRIPSFGETVGEGASPLAHSLAENSPQWTGLFRVYRVETVAFDDGLVRARVTWGGGVLSPWEESGRVLRLLERLAVVSEGHTGLELKARENAGAARCPYCHADLAGGPEPEHDPSRRATRPCEGCGTRYHVECWDELGGCAILGCRARPRTAERTV